MQENSLKKRFYSLDFIKICATLIIIFHHYQQLSGTRFARGINFYGGKFYFGNIVELFFVLSGFFAFSYVKKIEEGLSFKSFFAKRFLRFFPVMTLGAVLYEILLALNFKLFGNYWIFDKPTSLWSVLVTSLGLQNGWGIENPLVNNPTWYISSLLLCYVVLYFLVYLNKRASLTKEYLYVFMIFLGMGVATYNINVFLLNSTTARSFVPFFTGVLLGQILHERKVGIKAGILSGGVCTVFILLLIFDYPFMENGIQYLLTFVFYPSLIVLFMSEGIKKVFFAKLLGTVGEISFVAFVLHLPVYFALTIAANYFGLPVAFQSGKSMILFAAICYAISTAVFFLFDRPIAEKIRKNINL